MRAGASFHVSPLGFLERPLFGLSLVFVFVCCCLVVFGACFAFLGLPSNRTSESTNDSLPGVTKTAAVVTMSAATVQKKIIDCGSGMVLSVFDALDLFFN